MGTSGHKLKRKEKKFLFFRNQIGIEGWRVKILDVYW